MPGLELMGIEEQSEILDIFNRGNGVMFRHGFDQLRNGVFKVKSFEEAFAEKMGVGHALAVSSGTAALKVAIEAGGVRAGDEVITQAFTFVATAEAIIECGATPIIAEIDNTLNIDPSNIETLITSRTKAIIVVHMLGTPVDMDAVIKIAKKHSLKVIEDTAWGCGGSYNGKKLGTIGDVGTFSFDYAKAMTTGEGGMVVTNNHSIDANARAYHDHGHENNPTVPRWEDTRKSSGFNYRMSEMQGAVGLAQLKKLDQIISAQRQTAGRLAEVIATFQKVNLRPSPAGSFETFDALVFQTASKEAALRCRSALVKNGYGTKILPEAVTWHFAKTWDHMPLLVAGAGGTLKNKLENSAAILSKCVSLPISLKMTDAMPQILSKSLQEAL